MSSLLLRDSVSSTLQSFILNHEHEFTAQDILRVFELEARLLQQGQQIKDMLRSDPFGHLEENILPKTMDRICKMITVQDHHVVLTKAGYSNIIGVVRLQADERMKKHGAVTSNVELTFSYERQIAECSETGAASLLYFIEVARDNGPTEKLLWIEIFAHGATPSHLPLKNLISDSDDEHDDGGWEDIDNDDDEEEEAEETDGKSQAEKLTAQKRKSEAMSSSESDAPCPTVNGSGKEKGGGGGDDTKDSNKNHDDADKDENDESDRYRAGIDPDVLSRLLEWTQIGPMADITAFFLLMTFPFYEQEFEIVGAFLDSVFGSDEDDESNNDTEEG